jgi:hypothetical protein
MKSIVYIELPKAGLGNKLIVWSRGYIFAQKNNLKIFRNSWFYLNIGPFLRKERKKRMYFLYMKRNNFLSIILSTLLPIIPKKIIKKNPNRIENKNRFYIYIFTWQDNIHDFFNENISNRELIRNGIISLLQNKIQNKIYKLKNPIIGLHIRRGDFNLQSGKTEDNYFIKLINDLRTSANENLHVTIFTDGTEEEMETFLNLGNIQIAEEKEDILDIFELSNSKICILSFYSSFSFWAGFLCKNQVISHPKDNLNF